jgi:hypothetical protein
LAFFHFPAVAACRKTFLYSAFADSAEIFTVKGFDPFGAASCAVDVLWENCGVIQFAQEFRRFLAQ